MQRVGRTIRYGTALTPWMLAYAEWLVLECVVPPKLVHRTTRARGLARAPITIHQLRLLEVREDFVAYCGELAKGPLEAARAKFASSFPTYVEAHRKALDSAVSAGDYKAIGALAEPVLDRVYPKKAENVAATQVNITLTPTQLQGMTAYAAPLLTVEEADAQPD